MTRFSAVFAASLISLFLLVASVASSPSPDPVAFEPDDGVTEIDGADAFAETISKSKRASVAYFYLPRCPACAQTKSVFLAAATKLEGLATAAAIDCSSKPNQQLCAEHVKVGYPTFKAFGAIPKDNPYTGVPFKDAKVVDAQPLTPRHLVEAALSGLPESLVEFAGDFETLERAREEAAAKELPLAVLFTAKSKAPPLFRAVAAELAGRAAFVAASAADDEISESLFGEKGKKKEAPALFVETVAAEGDEDQGRRKEPSSSERQRRRLRHAGPLNAEAMRLFLLPHAASEVDAEFETPSNDASDNEDDRATPRVVELIEDEAQLEEVLSRPQATLLAFFDSRGKNDRKRACSEELEAFNAAAVELGPLCRAAAIDVSPATAKAERKGGKTSPPPPSSSLLPASAIEQFLRKPGGGPVDGDAFARSPCSLQVVGIPAGADDRGEPDEWTVLLREEEGGGDRKRKPVSSSSPSSSGEKKKKGEATAAAPWASSRSLSRFITATFPHAALLVESEAAMAALMSSPDAPPPPPGGAAAAAAAMKEQTPKLRPVALLFSDKPSPPVPPLMHALATNFGPLGYGVGVVPPSAEAMRKQFRVEKVPSLVLAYMPPPEMLKKQQKSSPSSSSSSPPPASQEGSLAVQGYRGPIKYALVDAWLRMAAPHVGIDLPEDATASAAAGLLRRGAAGGLGARKKKNVDDDDETSLPQLQEASKPGDLSRICPSSSKKLCVLVALRGGADPKKTRDGEALAAARKAAVAWSEQPLTFVAVDAKRAAGRGVLSSLGVDPDAAPTAVVYSPAKLRAIPMPENEEKGEPEPLTEKSLNGLLDSVFTGRAVTRPVASLPEIEGESGSAKKEIGDEDDDGDDDSSASAKTVEVEAALKKSLNKESSSSSKRTTTTLDREEL